MSVPDWRTSTAGARVRVALWLLSEVGEGGTFTKAQLRDAFPAVEQIDRRMRDLRAEGWTISTYREDRALAPDELRLVHAGGPVWEPGYRSRANVAITDKQRQAVFAADGYACSYCGITGGESYPDDPLQTAKLTVGRVPSSDGPARLQTVCARCHAAVKDELPDTGVLDAVRHLDPDERSLLRDWIRRGARPHSRLEQVWARYRRLPSSTRDEIQAHLDNPEP